MKKYKIIEKENNRIIKEFEFFLEAQRYCEKNAIDYDYFEIVENVGNIGFGEKTKEIVEKFGNNVYTGTEWYLDTQNIEKRLREALNEQREDFKEMVEESRNNLMKNPDERDDSAIIELERLLKKIKE